MKSKLSVHDLMIISLQLKQKQYIKSFLFISKKCKEAIYRLKINTFTDSLDQIEIYFPSLETLYLVNPEDIPMTKYKYQIISSSPSIFQQIKSISRNISREL